MGHPPRASPGFAGSRASANVPAKIGHVLERLVVDRPPPCGAISGRSEDDDPRVGWSSIAASLVLRPLDLADVLALEHRLRGSSPGAPI